MSEAIYPKGIRIFDRHPKSPAFVKGSVVITVNELIQFCKENPNLLSEYEGKKQLKLQMVEKKDGGLTFKVDTYKTAAASDNDFI